LRKAARSRAGAQAAVSAALRDYVADRLDMTGAGLTPADALRALQSHAVPAHVAERYRDVFEQAFNAGFDVDGTRGADAGALAGSALAVIAEVEACLDPKSSGNTGEPR